MLGDSHICPRHGDVTQALFHYQETGELTDEMDLNLEKDFS
jgi:hypothetical protein